MKVVVSPRLLGLGVNPCMLTTSSRSSSGVRRTEEGYQPVGMKPSARPCPLTLTSNTATLLLSAFATKRQPPSRDSARLSGVEPGRSAGVNEDERVSSARPVSASSTVTELRPPLATKSRRPSGASTSSLGCSPTGQRARTRPSSASSTATSDKPHRLAYRRWREAS